MQILTAAIAVFFRCRQIVYDPLPNQVARQRLPPAALLVLRLFRLLFLVER
jgi:hypothetical protein